uniref:Virulence protein RhuM family protein n=1 Tax=Candidatus Kentrum sp. DK TaxID=2126562 RepID=A0A450SRG8_9GAMM|nr:MAG: Virulence protein RhuM family protein [Candidatus Kentron sp. DK]VFJ66640.1 MAG: Virulence protein RhuM family protein [Candidatus Kentron sp. DK]
MLLYKTDDGRIRIETRMQDETIWLTINQMAELFGVDKSGISRHLKNIFESRELERHSVVANFATTASDGKTYQVEYFNLDAIISVGYRVNSIRGTQFRIWATGRLREYLVKGFTMDDQRLKEAGSSRYFEELLARIRDIRSSEVNAKVRLCSITRRKRAKKRSLHVVNEHFERVFNEVRGREMTFAYSSSEKVFWRKVWTSTPPVLITTPKANSPASFFSRCRTKCTGRPTATRRRN